jgi:hypothetical protein
VKLNTSHCRVWRAGSQLLGVLPSVADAPRYNPYLTNNDIVAGLSHRGMTWTTCMTCDWHTDWSQVFELLMIRGSGRLHIGNVSETAGESGAANEFKARHVCPIERGDVIQLHGMVQHRVTARGYLAFLDIIGRKGRKPAFKGIDLQENTFIKVITK